MLKYLIPGLAGLGVVLFAAYAIFDPFRVQDVAVDVGHLSVSGDRVTMELPRLTGFNKNQQSYNVTAKSASQKITAPGLIDLTDLEAIITMPDQGKATLTATTGKFNSDKEFLTLTEKVRVSSTKGYSADLTSANVDFKAGTVASQEAVKVQMQSGLVKAGSLLVQGGGDRIMFGGGVATRFEGKLTDAEKATAAGTPHADSQGSIE